MIISAYIISVYVKSHAYAISTEKENTKQNFFYINYKLFSYAILETLWK